MTTTEAYGPRPAFRPYARQQAGGAPVAPVRAPYTMTEPKPAPRRPAQAALPQDDAVFDDTLYRAGPGESADWRALLHGAGALCSLALVAGICVWGYAQVMRDVSGVPVVEALDGPMREAPAVPGGQISDHAGLAVNAVKAGGPAEPPSETLRLAPAEPSLAEEDVPVADLAPRPGVGPEAVPGGALGAQAEGARAQASAPEEEPLPLVEVRLDTGAAGPGTAASARATGPGMADAAASETAAAPAAASADGAEAGAGRLPRAPAALPAAAIPDTSRMTPQDAGRSLAIAAAIAEGLAPAGAEMAVSLPEGPGLARSLRPQRRPGGRAAVRVASADASLLPAATAPAPEADIREVPEGTRLVQLGAFDTVEEARGAWGTLARRFGPLMEDKARLVQQAEAGGRTFWRLRAEGFEDLAAARRFCAALLADEADCIPVVAR